MAGGRCLSARGLLHTSQLSVEAGQGVMQSRAPPRPRCFRRYPHLVCAGAWASADAYRELGALELPIVVLAWRERAVLVTEMLFAVGGRCWFGF